jgi:hypothetical protein
MLELVVFSREGSHDSLFQEEVNFSLLSDKADGLECSDPRYLSRVCFNSGSFEELEHGQPDGENVCDYGLTHAETLQHSSAMTRASTKDGIVHAVRDHGVKFQVERRINTGRSMPVLNRHSLSSSDCDGLNLKEVTSDFGMPSSAGILTSDDVNVGSNWLPNRESYSSFLCSLEPKEPIESPSEASLKHIVDGQSEPAASGEPHSERLRYVERSPSRQNLFTLQFHALEHGQNSGNSRASSNAASSPGDVAEGPMDDEESNVQIKEEHYDSSYEVKESSRPALTTSGRNRGRGKANEPKYECQVCGDVAAGYHCGAYVCEACKVIWSFSVCVVILHVAIFY